MRFWFFISTLLFLLLSSGAVYSQSAEVAVLSSDNPADFAVASLLAKRLGAETVVTPWGTINNETVQLLAELNSTNITEVYIIGGEVAVPSPNKFISETGISLKRFNGSNRYETAALVALEWKNASSVAVAYGYDEEGIDEAKRRVVLEDGPLLLVPQNFVPPMVKEALINLSSERVIFVPSPDTIQNYIHSDISALGMTVETVQQDHEKKTLSMIIKANSTLLFSESRNFTFEAHEKALEIAGKLIEEAVTDLESAEEFYKNRIYYLAFNQAVRAKFKAETSLKIKEGIIKIPLDVEKDEKEVIKDGNEPVEISRILLNPLEFSEKEVIIKATVEGVVEVGGKAYVQLFDGTGRIIATFPADREYMLSKGLIFMADPDIVGESVRVNGSLHLNVPLGGDGSQHGTSAFAYLIEVKSINLAKK